MHAKSNRQVALRSHLQFISLRLASPPSLLPHSPSVCTRVFILPDFLYFAGFCFGLVWFLSSANRIDPPASAPPPWLHSLSICSWKLLHSCTIEKTSERDRERACESMRNAQESVWSLLFSLPPSCCVCVRTFVCVHLTVCPCLPGVCVCVCLLFGLVSASGGESSRVDCLHLPLKCELLSELVFRIFLSNLFVVCSYLAGAATSPAPLYNPLFLTPYSVCVCLWGEVGRVAVS